MGSYEDYSSYFIQGRALFGSYPTQGQVDDLRSMGVSHFVDLTVPGEVFPVYSTGEALYVNHPILDRKVPTDVTRFAAFILTLHRTLKELGESQKMYIHCKGGHGRAGIVVAILLKLDLGDITTTRAMELTTVYHNSRKIMRQKWRDIGSPQTRSQKSYVHRFFGELVFYRAYRKGPSHGFSNYSFHTVDVSSSLKKLAVGTFGSSEAAFQASKKPFDTAYVQKQMQAKNPRVSRKIGERQPVSQKWLTNRYETMKSIVQLKIDQHEEVSRNLLRTGLRSLVFNSRTDPFFGTGGLQGRNHLGKILMDIRNEKYHELAYVFSPRLETQVAVSSSPGR